MNETTVTTPNELEIRVERVFDAPRAHVFSVWTDPALIPEWWGGDTVVEEMDVRPGGTYASGRPSASSRASTARSRARVRGSRRADEADADDALRDVRGPRQHHAVRRGGGREGSPRAH